MGQYRTCPFIPYSSGTRVPTAIIAGVTDEQSVRRDMCEAGRRLHQLGLIGACEGNLTARVDDKRLLCTPSGVSKGRMSEDELVVIDLEGNVMGQGTASSEVLLHLVAYRMRPDCMAVVHAHPLCATAFTVSGVPIPNNVLPEAGQVLGPVATVPFAQPGTMDVPYKMEPFLADHKTFLLSHHGAVTLGRNVLDACDRMETLERIAKILMHAKLLGEVKPLPQHAVETLKTTSLHGNLI